MAAATASALAAASAPPRWLPPVDLSERTADAVLPSVAVDAKGDTIVTWAQVDDGTWTVEKSERPAGGRWEAVRALSQPTSQLASPQLAVAGDLLVAVWERSDSSNMVVQATDRDPKTRRWNAPKTLSLDGQDAQPPLRVDLNARGDTGALWASVTPSGWTIEAAYRPAGGNWEAAVPLQESLSGATACDIVVDPTGRAVAVWAATSGSSTRAYAATRDTDGNWSRATAISGPDGSGSIAPQLALEGNGDVLAVWSRSTGAGNVIESATLTATNERWSRAQRLFGSSGSAFAPAVSVNKRGDGVIVWTRSDQSTLAVMASSRDRGSAWSPPVVLSAHATGAQSPRVVLDSRGDALVIWTQSIGESARVVAAGLSAGASSWSAPQVLSKPGADALTPSVSMKEEGDGAVAWARYAGPFFVIQAEGYDRSGPTLSGLSIPTTGTVGRRLTFTVAAKDVWTTVRAIRWTFGDGTAGSGRATGHVYTRPGRYAARVTVTDAFGHATSVRRLVTIAGG